MAFSPTSPLTGATQTGLTSPTYTLTADSAPTNNGKQFAVTALGGTQTGVTVHTTQSPFFLNFIRPASVKTLTMSADGTVKAVPTNTYQLLTLKGATPFAGAPVSKVRIRTEIVVPAGTENYDAINIRAALSAHIGALSNTSSGIGDTVVSGLL